MPGQASGIAAEKTQWLETLRSLTQSNLERPYIPLHLWIFENRYVVPPGENADILYDYTHTYIYICIYTQYVCYVSVCVLHTVYLCCASNRVNFAEALQYLRMALYTAITNAAAGTHQHAALKRGMS